MSKTEGPKMTRKDFVQKLLHEARLLNTIIDEVKLETKLDELEEKILAEVMTLSPEEVKEAIRQRGLDSDQVTARIAGRKVPNKLK